MKEFDEMENNIFLAQLKESKFELYNTKKISIQFNKMYTTAYGHMSFTV